MTSALEIDIHSPRSLWEQIVSGIRALLVSGQFRPGDMLPSVRQLALDLRIHHNTVAQAYRALEDEGWVEVRHGRGARVLERPKPTPSAEAERRFERQLNDLVAEAIASGVSEAAVRQKLIAIGNGSKGR